MFGLAQLLLLAMFCLLAYLLIKNRFDSSRPPVAVGGTASWTAEIIGLFAGVLGGSEYGTFTLDRGTLRFLPDDAENPGWSAPCSSLSVRRRSFLAPRGADLELSGPMGEVKCNVSHERINRLMTNDFKNLRERGVADEFIAALHAHGAQVR